MNENKIVLEIEELELLCEIDSGEWASAPLADNEKTVYQNYAKYTKSLQKKDKRRYAFL